MYILYHEFDTLSFVMIVAARMPGYPRHFRELWQLKLRQVELLEPR